MSDVWIELIGEPFLQQNVDLKSILSTFEDVLMCHVADVWKQAVQLLWKKEQELL